MKTLAAIAVGLLIVGCSTPEPTFTLPVGTKIVFENQQEADNFRAATHVDADHITKWITLDRPINVTK